MLLGKRLKKMLRMRRNSKENNATMMASRDAMSVLAHSSMQITKKRIKDNLLI